MRPLLLLSCSILAACAGRPKPEPVVDGGLGVFVATGHGAPNSAGVLIAQFSAMETAAHACDAQHLRFVPLADALSVPGHGAQNTYAVRFACVATRDFPPAAERVPR